MRAQISAIAIGLLVAACGSGDTSSSPAPGEDGGALDATGGKDGGADVSIGDAQPTPIDAASDAARADASQGPGVPPFGGSSGGSGGAAPVNGDVETAGGVTYRLIVPASPAKPAPLLVVYSGTEGGQQMTQNLIGAGPSTGTDGFLRAVLDGVQYNGDGNAGATVLDDVRAKYDVDNDRTYLLGESAGTTAAFALGFHLRESYFAAYWANDVNATDGPAQTAAQIGFAPWGQVGPGGDLADANAIVSAMQTAGYRLPNPAPYAGPGSTTHGDPQQFLAALGFFPGKSRR